MLTKTFTHTKLILLLTALFFSSQLVLAQSKQAILSAKQEKLEQHAKVKSVVMDNHRMTPHVISLDKNASVTKASIPGLLQEVLVEKSAKNNFATRPTIKLKNNEEVVRFQQFYENIKVEHGNYNALTKDGQVSALIGEYYDLDNINTFPSMIEYQALGIAKAFVNANDYAWEVMEESWNGFDAPAIAEIKRNAFEEYFPHGELVVVDDYDTPEADLDLAYKFNIYATEPLSRAYVYVNAHTGKIMLKDAIIKHASVPTTVPTRYSGNRVIYTKEVNISDNEPNPRKDATLVPDMLLSSSTGLPYPLTQLTTYVLIDDSKGGGTTIETYDLNGVGGLPVSVPAYGQARSFTDINNNWMNPDIDNPDEEEHVRGNDVVGTTNEAQNDDFALDAHWGAAQVYDYWKNIHNRNSFDDAGADILSYVHSGIMYDNAFWNGSVMTYGDGMDFKPLTSLDVCGHEIGHAICSNTADLVYASESGAMNEGFSDVWAACQEYYTIVTENDPNLPYKPFGIGEQIAESGSALRWMDNPKIENDPDTYGGDNFKEPDCTPTLANDQCGVHSNSGLLNKWFYLLTVGSTTGSGPNATYAGTGVNADDGVNDNGHSYIVTGLGFAISEKIAFGTEVLLTPNATFAEARTASIAYVTTAYGPCSPQMISNVNAWYAIGVGLEWNGCNQPNGFTELTTLASEASTSTDCDAFTTIQPAIFINGSGPTGSATITVSGTATEGVDFEIPTKTVTGGGIKPISVNIFDDAIIEGDETIILTVSGLANATHTITVRDDDVNPLLSSQQVVLLSQNFDNYSLPNPFTDSDWAVLKYQIPPGQDLNWFFNAQYGAFISLTGTTPNYATVDANAESILRSPLVDGRGLKNITVEAFISYQGEDDGTPLDYGSLVYSFDGVNFIEFLGTQYASETPVLNEEISIPLASSFNGKQFYLGFKWFNDPLLSTVYSFSVNDVLVKGDAVSVASTTESSIEEDLSPNSTVYFYSATSGEIMAKIENLSSHDYGCTTVTVDRAGTGAVEFQSEELASHLAGKTFMVTPTTNNSAGAYNITLYYTTAEVEGWQTATMGNTWSIDALIHKTAGSISAYMSGDPVTSTVTAAATKDDEYEITAGFTTGFSGFGVGAAQVALPVELIEFSGYAKGTDAVLNWKTATELNNKGFTVQRRMEGNRNFENVGWVDGAGTTSVEQSYQLIDQDLGAAVYYYRLEQLDFDGERSYSDIIALQITDTKGGISIQPNPASDYVNISLNESANSIQQLTIIGMNGQIIKQLQLQGNRTRVDITDLVPGVYYFKVKGDVKTEIERLIVH